MTHVQNPADAARARLSSTLLQVGQGDVEAFRHLHILTKKKLLRECYRVCKNEEDAEEILHEVFLVVWQKASLWHPDRGNPISWLSTIARNRAIDWLRREKRIVDTTLDDFPLHARSIDCPEHAALLACAKTQLTRHLDALDSKQKDALNYVYLREMTHAQIAILKDVPLGTVKSWVRRGLAKLKSEMSECGDHAQGAGADR